MLQNIILYPNPREAHISSAARNPNPRETHNSPEVTVDQIFSNNPDKIKHDVLEDGQSELDDTKDCNLDDGNQRKEKKKKKAQMFQSSWFDLLCLCVCITCIYLFVSRYPFPKRHMMYVHF